MRSLIEPIPVLLLPEREVLGIGALLVADLESGQLPGDEPAAYRVGRHLEFCGDLLSCECGH